MRWKFISQVFKKEWVSTLRDPKTLRATVLGPLIMVPLFLIGMPLAFSSTSSGERDRKQIVAAVGLEHAPAAFIKALESNTTIGNGVTLKAVDDPLEAVQKNGFDAAIIIPEDLPTKAGLHSGTIRVLIKPSNQRAQYVQAKINAAVEAYGQSLAVTELVGKGLSLETIHPVSTQTISAETDAERAAGFLAFIIPTLLLQAILLGAQGTAIDATAGEKERGTLEALLVTPVSRLEVVLGKLLSVMVFALISSIISLTLTGVSGFASRILLPEATVGGGLLLTPSSFIAISAVVLTSAGAISAILLLICIYARSFKEAQTYLAPVFMLVTLVSFVLTFIDFLPHGKFMYGIPFFGSMLSVFDSVKGNVDIQNTLLAVMMNLFTAAIGITLAKKNFQQEQVLFRN